MLLSSIRRLKLFCAGDNDTVLSDSLKINRTLGIWLPSVSQAIENHLKRTLYLDQYTEFLDVKNGKTEYWVSANPIHSLIDVYEDSQSLWTGDEQEIDDPFVHQLKNSVVMPFYFSYAAQCALRIRYLGGMARHAVNSRYAASSSTGTWAVGKYVKGGTSGAIGIVNAMSSGVLTIEVYYGQFSIGETVSQYDTENGNTSATATAVIGKYPELWFVSRTGDFTAAKYLKGRTSGAIASITSVNGTPAASITFSAISGTLLENETVNQYENAACTTESSNSDGSSIKALIGYVENRALCEAYPDIVLAAEMQVRYMRAHMLDFENGASQKDGRTVRREENRGMLLPEVKDKLQPYVNEYGY